MSSDKRNIKIRNFQKLTDHCRFKEVAEAWEKVDHEYNNINQMVVGKISQKNRHTKHVKGSFLRKNSLQAKCNLSAQFNCPQKKINKTMNQCVKPQRTYTLLEKVFDSSINMSHLSW